MDWYRLRHTIGMCFCKTAVQRAEYIRKHDIFMKIGRDCMTMFRKIPLYPKLISFGDNVWVASNVMFVTHDVIHQMVNRMGNNLNLTEHIGCIEIKDNVFIGSNTTILYNITIGSNTIIAAGSLVNKNLAGNGVYAGVPAQYICSIQEFIKKRNSAQTVTIEKGRGGLSEKTIEDCWERFREISDNFSI